MCMIDKNGESEKEIMAAKGACWQVLPVSLHSSLPGDAQVTLLPLCIAGTLAAGNSQGFQGNSPDIHHVWTVPII